MPEGDGGSVEPISAVEVKALIDSGAAIVVDVREPREIEASGKVPGALEIPRGRIEAAADAASPERDHRLQPAKTVVLYCGAGSRAASAGAALRQLGFKDVRNMGGFNDWDQEGFPVAPAGG